MIHIKKKQEIPEEEKYTQIYLVTNCYGDPNKVYIGKEHSHQKESRKGAHKRRFGKQIEFNYIDECFGWVKLGWKPLETFWIQYFIFLGFEILNIQKEGGGGPPFHNEDTLKKMRKPKKEGTGEKISKANKGKPKPEGFGEAQSKKLKGKPNIKISEANKGRKQSEETCKKKSKSLKGVPKSKEHCLNMSISKKGVSKPEGFGELITKNRDHSKIAEKHLKPILQYDLKGNFIKEWSSKIEAGNALKISIWGIGNCCRESQSSTGNFIWKFKIE